MRLWWQQTSRQYYNIFWEKNCYENDKFKLFIIVLVYWQYSHICLTNTASHPCLIAFIWESISEDINNKFELILFLVYFPTVSRKGRDGLQIYNIGGQRSRASSPPAESHPLIKSLNFRCKYLCFLLQKYIHLKCVTAADDFMQCSFFRIWDCFFLFKVFWVLSNFVCIWFFNAWMYTSGFSEILSS